MRLSPDELIFWHYGALKLNGTIAFTWVLMLLLTGGSILVTRRLSTGMERSRWQNLLEIIVTGIEGQIADVGLAVAQVGPAGDQGPQLRQFRSARVEWAAGGRIRGMTGIHHDRLLVSNS